MDLEKTQVALLEWVCHEHLNILSVLNANSCPLRLTVLAPKRQSSLRIHWVTATRYGRFSVRACPLNKIFQTHLLTYPFQVTLTTNTSLVIFRNLQANLGNGCHDGKIVSSLCGFRGKYWQRAVKHVLKYLSPYLTVQCEQVLPEGSAMADLHAIAMDHPAGETIKVRFLSLNYIFFGYPLTPQRSYWSWSYLWPSTVNVVPTILSA